MCDLAVRLGGMVRALRVYRSMTQGEFANSISWSQPRLSLLENGKAPVPRLDSLFEMADALSIPHEWFMNLICKVMKHRISSPPHDLHSFAYGEAYVEGLKRKWRM